MLRVLVFSFFLFSYSLQASYEEENFMFLPLAEDNAFGAEASRWKSALAEADPEIAQFRKRAEQYKAQGFFSPDTDVDALVEYHRKELRRPQDAIDLHRRKRGSFGEPFAKQQQRQGLWNYLLSEYDMGARAEVRKRYGKVTDLQHPYSEKRKYNDVARAWARNEGYEDNPEVFFESCGLPLPEGARTQDELFSAMGNELASRARAAWLITLPVRIEETHRATHWLHVLKEREKMEQEQEQKRIWEERHRKEIATTTGSILAYLAALAWLIYRNIKRGLTLPVWAALAAAILLLITVCGDRNIPDIFGNKYHVWEFYEIPDGYYQLLRLSVTATALYLGYLTAKGKRHPLTILACAAITILFQPLEPISFKRETWLWIDLATAPALLLCATHCNKEGKHENEQT